MNPEYYTEANCLRMCWTELFQIDGARVWWEKATAGRGLATFTARPDGRPPHQPDIILEVHAHDGVLECAGLSDAPAALSEALRAFLCGEFVEYDGYVHIYGEDPWS